VSKLFWFQIRLFCVNSCSNASFRLFCVNWQLVFKLQIRASVNKLKIFQLIHRPSVWQRLSKVLLHLKMLIRRYFISLQFNCAIQTCYQQFYSANRLWREDAKKIIFAFLTIRTFFKNNLPWCKIIVFLAVKTVKNGRCKISLYFENNFRTF
jgi:hypothetical protein